MKDFFLSKNFAATLLVGVIILLCTSLRENRIEKGELDRNRPIINIRIQELENNELYLELDSLNKNGSTIDKLYFSFDIPGVFKKHEIGNEQKIGDLLITPQFLSGYNDLTTSQTLQFEINTIHPSGSLRIYTYYEPTTLISQFVDEGKKIFSFFPVMDLHDYLVYDFSWTYKGTSRTERGNFDLEYLKYIKNDNQNLIEQKSYLKWALKDEKEKNPPTFFSKYITSLNQEELKSKKEVSITETPFSADTLIVEQDSLTLISTIKGLYQDYESVREMELRRRLP